MVTARRCCDGSALRSIEDEGDDGNATSIKFPCEGSANGGGSHAEGASNHGVQAIECAVEGTSLPAEFCRVACNV